MGKGYSKDLRERAVVMVEEGESRREVARVRILAKTKSVLTLGTMLGPSLLVRVSSEPIWWWLSTAPVVRYNQEDRSIRVHEPMRPVISLA